MGLSCDSQVVQRLAALSGLCRSRERLRGCSGVVARLKGNIVGCASLQTQTTPYPLYEALSGRISLVNGTQVSGLGCVCAWPEVCVCFLLLMAPKSLLQLDQSSLALNGPGWRPPPAPPFFSFGLL